MHGVVRTYPRKDLDKRAPEACRIMREEVKAFLSADDAKYTSARECVMAGSLHDGIIVASIVANVIERLI